MNRSEQETARSREFYDEFLRSRMIGYRLYKNPRIENIKRRAGGLVRPGQRILEIGCGIGIVSEFMAHQANDVTVFAGDLSAQNIGYAQRTVSCPNIAWKVVDVIQDFSEIVEWINGPIDLIVLADVLEHIPSRHHHKFFADLGRILSPGGKILLTLPSPQYQRFLTTHHPDELQPIDETLELRDLIALASQAGCAIKHYSLEDTGETRNQYIHCILDSAPGVDVLAPAHRGLSARVLSRINDFINRRVLLPFRKRKYIDRVRADAVSTDKTQSKT